MDGKDLFAKLKPLEADDKLDIIQLDNFRSNLLFRLSDNSRFKTILKDPDNLKWKPAEVTDRGFTDNPSTTVGTTTTPGITGAEKRIDLDFMLGVIAGYIPVLSRNFVVNQAQSLSEIWIRLRSYYGCRKTGAQVFKVLAVTMRPNESPEALWERMYAAVEDSLFDPIDNIEHPNAPVVKESLGPTTLNLLVGLWLKAINPALPGMIQQKFTTEFRNKTPYFIREDITMSISSILQELETASISRYGRSQPVRTEKNTPRFQAQNTQGYVSNKNCCFCKLAGRKYDHYLLDCTNIPVGDQKHIKIVRSRAQTRQVGGDLEPQQAIYSTIDGDDQLAELNDNLDINRVSLEASPTLYANFNNLPVQITLDSGAEANLISTKETKRLGINVLPTHQGASQADGATPLNIRGECQFTVTRGHHDLMLNCLVVSNLSCPILAGVPFHTYNDVSVRMSKRTIHLGDCCQVDYSNNDITPNKRCSAKIRSVAILRVSSQTTLMPGDTIKFALPSDFRTEKTVAIEPRESAPSFKVNDKPWLCPTIESVQDGMVSLINASDELIHIRRHEQICNVLRTEEFNIHPSESDYHDNISPDSTSSSTLPSGTFFSDTVEVDPSSQLPTSIRDKFIALNRKYDEAFNPKVGLYNGASGKFEAVINIGNTQPAQTRGRCPQYSHANKVLFQDKCDELEEEGVLATPESVGVSIENVNPSFLVKKPSGGNRLVTKFGGIAEYVKPQPSLLPNVDDTLRSIGKWKYIIKTDLTLSYYQIPVSVESMKYCGICTPFKGLRVYTRCGMGLPGSEVALEELLSRILGHLIAQEKVAKIADDLYCGAETPEGVLEIWEEVLSSLYDNGLHISGRKTVICPVSTTILGWVWTNGSISASPHRLSALESCKPPETVFGLRSFIGAYKFLGKVLPAYSDVLSPLEAAVGGRQSKERIVWTSELESHYKAAQRHLSKAKSLVLPRPSDELRIVTDASVSKCGLAATLYVIRDSKLHLAGFFNAKMTPNQIKWLPCEVEALCIGAAVRTFAPYIVQSRHRTQVLTDSRPCVQAYQKLCKGEFSNSARVMTFLSILCDYGIKIGHVRGCDNLVADFSSRNPIECSDQNCQICKYVACTAQSVVRAVELSDITSTASVEMFTNRKAWKSIQQSCPTLRRVYAQLSQGTRPLKNARNLGEVRRYLKVCKIANDGLLVVQQKASMSSEKDRVVIPTGVAHGIVTAFHLKLLHPSRNQLTKVMNRQFFALNMPDVIEKIHSHCDTCTAMQNIPTHFKEQSTTPPADIGLLFSADVIKRNRQLILAVRENISAYTHASLIPDETADSLREGLLLLISLFRSSCGQSVEIRVDTAPGFRSLLDDKTLHQYGIKIDLGDEKNINKNPIAERSISEIHAQLTRIQPTGGKISASTLALAISNVNSQIRHCGLSAREVWTQRDQFSGKQIPISDREVILKRHEQRVKNHPSSAKYKARGRTDPIYADVKIGDLVYLMQDRDKLKARDRYLVVDVKHPYCSIQKFIGNQLRTRVYRVPLTDCVIIKSSIIRETPRIDVFDDANDYILDGGGSVLVNDENARLDNNIIIEPDDDINFDEESFGDDTIGSNNNDAHNTSQSASDDENQPEVLRPQRTLRRPVMLNDYVSDFSDDDQQ